VSEKDLPLYPGVLHPDLTGKEREFLLRRGVALFNSGRFYDCHEAFEEIWRSTSPEPRELFQGLIQVAVGLHHVLDNGRPAAGRRVLGRGLERLKPLRPRAAGVELDGLCAAAARWYEWLQSREGKRPALPLLGLNG
jgi:predicted metal-dependent hydrolase